MNPRKATSGAIFIESLSIYRTAGLSIRPAFGNAGVWFTVVVAIIATTSGVIASVFAASRMPAMLTRMKQVPHRRPSQMPARYAPTPPSIPSRSPWHWQPRSICAGSPRWGRSYLDHGHRYQLGPAAPPAYVDRLSRPSSQPGSVLDIVVLGAFVRVQASSDALSLYASAIGLARIVFRERLFMRSHTKPDGTVDMYQSRAGRTADIGVSRGLVAVVEGHRGVGQRSVEKVSAAVEMVFDG